MLSIEEIFTNEYLSRTRIIQNVSVIEDFTSTLVSFCVELSHIAQTCSDLNSYFLSTCSSLVALSSLSCLKKPSNAPLAPPANVINEVLKSKLANLISQKTTTNSSIGKNLNDMIEIITDYANQITHFEQNYARLMEKQIEVHESTLFKFMSLSKKKRSSVADALFESKIGISRIMFERLQFQHSVLDKISNVTDEITQNFTNVMAGDRLEILRLKIDEIISVSIESLIPSHISRYQQNIGLIPMSGEQNISDSSRVVHGSYSGYLWRRSKGPLKQWTRKFFEIKENRFIMKGDNQEEIVVVDDLYGCKWSESELDDRHCVFECAWGDNAIYLQAEGDLELKDWMIALLALKSLRGVESLSVKEVLENANMKIAIPVNEIDLKKQVFTGEDFGGDHVDFSLPEHVLDSQENLELQDPPTLSGILSVKEMKANQRPVGANNKDYANMIWRTSTFYLLRSKLFVETTSYSNNMKEIIDLRHNVINRHYIQDCDESLFNRKFVFSVWTTGGGPIYYFAASSFAERQKWVFFLKEACNSTHIGADGLPYRVYRALSIRIIEGRNLSGDIYCEIFVGNERKSRTPVRKTGDHFWRQDYFFGDLYSLRYGVCIIVMSQSRVRDLEVGRIILTQTMLRGGETEAWFPVSNEGALSSFIPFAGSTSTPGDLKIKFKYEEDIVLTMDQYKPLLDTLGVDNPVIYDLANAASDLESISSLLLYIHDAQGNAIEWLKYLIDNEIDKTDDANVLFRGNSILTKALDAHMKLVGMEYLESVLGNVLREIVEEKVACEVDPSRIEKKETLKSNWLKLMGYSISIWNSIEGSKTRIPREMRVIFNYIQKSVSKKYGSANSKMQMVRYTSVSGFLFLRLFCPCILNPKLFAITRDYADVKTSRTLTLLAKTLQCLANLASFGVKEPYMVEMNTFIMDHVDGLMEFIDHVCSNTSNTTPIVSSRMHDNAVDIELYLSQLNRFIRNLKVADAKRKDSASNQVNDSPNIPPRTTSNSLMLASSAIEELISRKIG